VGFRNKKVIQRSVPSGVTLPSQHPLLARIYAARGVVAEAELDLGLSGLLPYRDLKGIEKAVGLLATALQRQQRILIVGDFDVDGATSCALAARALRACGASRVDYLVPNRFEYGYGLTPEIVAVAQDYRPDLIVTVDNGIASIAGVAAAKQAGIRVLITDHHLAGAELPDADAIVNPNQPGCAFAATSTAGVGVIFYLMIALRAHLREQGWFSRQGLPEPNMGVYLDLVALGTVADVVALERNNRILVQQGLQRIRAGQCCAGIKALIEVAGRDPAQLVASDLGFAVGPRLNAAGRLDDMSLGIECLLADTEESAVRMALDLDQLNRERRDIEAAMKEEALTGLADLDGASGQVGLCVYQPAWHQGVIGILAARIKARYHRPVIAFADAGGEEIKGSARSITGFHIRDALDLLAKRHPQLLSKFGGHAMAAGVTLKKRDYPLFAEAFDQVAREQLTPTDLEETLLTDGQLEAHQVTLALAEQLRHAGPWGQHFPEPLFEGQFRVLRQRLVGERHLKLQLQMTEGGPALEGIAFFIDPDEWPNEAGQISMVYRLAVNEFRGERSVQLVAEYLEAC